MTGRIRTIKPEWLDDELLAASSDAARVLSVALLLMADDYGRGRASRAELANAAWRYEMERDDGAKARETLAKVSRAFDELLAMRFATTYEVGGQRYFAIRNWSKHQRVDRPSKPRIPEPPQADSSVDPQPRERLASASREARECLESSSRDTRDRSGPPTSDLDLRPGSEERAETLAPSVVELERAERARAELRAYLVRGYQRRYEAETRDAWMGLPRAGQHVDEVLAWVLVQAEPFEAVDRLLDATFATSRFRVRRWPWAWIAEDPAAIVAGSTAPSSTVGIRDLHFEEA